MLQTARYLWISLTSPEKNKQICFICTHSALDCVVGWENFVICKCGAPADDIMCKHFSNVCAYVTIFNMISNLQKELKQLKIFLIMCRNFYLCRRMYRDGELSRDNEE